MFYVKQKENSHKNEKDDVKDVKNERIQKTGYIN